MKVNNGLKVDVASGSASQISQDTSEDPSIFMDKNNKQSSAEVLWGAELNKQEFKYNPSEYVIQSPDSGKHIQKKQFFDINNEGDYTVKNPDGSITVNKNIVRFAAESSDGNSCSYYADLTSQKGVLNTDTNQMEYPVYNDAGQVAGCYVRTVQYNGKQSGQFSRSLTSHSSRFANMQNTSQIVTEGTSGEPDLIHGETASYFDSFKPKTTVAQSKFEVIKNDVKSKVANNIKIEKQTQAQLDVYFDENVESYIRSSVSNSESKALFDVNVNPNSEITFKKNDFAKMYGEYKQKSGTSNYITEDEFVNYHRNALLDKKKFTPNGETSIRNLFRAMASDGKLTKEKFVNFNSAMFEKYANGKNGQDNSLSKSEQEQFIDEWNQSHK